ncbi:MAG: type IX secretion system membrane protein PorP/SprF [Mariniphaga sp.]
MTRYRKFNLSKSILIAVILFSFAERSLAQQDPMFTQYMHNAVSINPAYAGSRGTLNFVAMDRLQWVGIEGAPKTITFSVNSPLMGYNVGIGLSVLHDEIGPTKQTGIYADYAYHLKMSDAVKLSFGIKGGVNLYDVNLSDLRGAQNDSYVSLYGIRKMVLPNFGVGSYLYSDRFYIGLSIPKILQNSLSDDKNTTITANKEQRHLFLTGGIVFDISENIKFKPSSTIRMVSGAPVSIELSGAILLQDKLWIGGMCRFGDALGAMVKFDVTRQLSIGYSYDMTQSGLRPYSLGTHEIYFSYDIAFRNRKILSPRYF